MSHTLFTSQTLLFDEKINFLVVIYNKVSSIKQISCVLASNYFKLLIRGTNSAKKMFVRKT